MTDDRLQNVFGPDLYPNLDTRTRHPMSETRDLKEIPPANYPVSGFPLRDKKLGQHAVLPLPILPTPTPTPCSNYLCPLRRSGPRGFWARRSS